LLAWWLPTREGVVARVVIVGDGPGGLSAALFLVRGGHRVELFGLDKTAMHYAYLNNYLGAPNISGADFQRAARAQVAEAGVVPRDAEVAVVTAGENVVEVTLAAGETISGDYLILSEGKTPALARSLGLAFGESGAVVVDAEGRSSHPRIYAVGRSARPGRSQAIISAGDGAKAALDIIAREAGRDIQDWDRPSQT
jgi:thioredoxin reductase (NADPH)